MVVPTDYTTIIFSLIGLMFVAILGVYVWTFKIYRSLSSGIYSKLNTHLQDTKIHGEKKDFVSSEVFSALHTSLKESVDEIRTDVKTLLGKTR